MHMKYLEQCLAYSKHNYFIFISVTIIVRSGSTSDNKGENSHCPLGANHLIHSHAELFVEICFFKSEDPEKSDNYYRW